jgi:hypothetical protein
MYVLFYTPNVGLSGWEWFWVAVCALFDLAHVSVGYMQQSGRGRPAPTAPSSRI